MEEIANLAIGGILACLLGAAVIIRLRTAAPDSPKVKLAKYSSRCKFCNRKSLKVNATCSNAKRAWDCSIEGDHSHVHCEACDAEYLMQPRHERKWYE